MYVCMYVCMSGPPSRAEGLFEPSSIVIVYGIYNFIKPRRIIGWAKILN